MIFSCTFFNGRDEVTYSLLFFSFVLHCGAVLLLGTSVVVVVVTVLETLQQHELGAEMATRRGLSILATRSDYLQGNSVIDIRRTTTKCCYVCLSLLFVNGIGCDGMCCLITSIYCSMQRSYILPTEKERN